LTLTISPFSIIFIPDLIAIIPSAHISALSGADGIIAIKSGIKIIEKGEIVSVRQI
ncbi:MAG: hypothetical protein EPN88_14940, partial [Bacteroidetes bacterium]